MLGGSHGMLKKEGEVGFEGRSGEFASRHLFMPSSLSAFHSIHGWIQQLVSIRETK